MTLTKLIYTGPIVRRVSKAELILAYGRYVGGAGVAVRVHAPWVDLAGRGLTVLHGIEA
jgi:hypothetical protein